MHSLPARLLAACLHYGNCKATSSFPTKVSPCVKSSGGGGGGGG